ncbi:deoxyribonuclease V [Candidatus Parcubacteria bacterium]|nr:deoxyribonuclease V [Candidatus Parcubacteria bacterium]
MNERMKENQISPAEAIALQKKMREDLRIEPLDRPIKTIAGADVSLERFGADLYAGIIVLSYPDLRPIDHAVAKVRADFPYIPGLLSFREIPGLLECLAKLRTRPDLIVVDGQGIAHPRRLGIAAHLGLVADIPTIGSAKSRLFGAFPEGASLPEKAGDAAPLVDPRTGEPVGHAFKSKARSNPIIVSPGHRVSLEQSLDLARNCIRGYRLPEPTRLAHLLVNAFRKGEISE